MNTRVVRADIGAPEDVQRLIQGLQSETTPLKGVFHLAMVIDDAPLSALTSERLRTVMAPKAHGAWLLHENTKDLELDCFVIALDREHLAENRLESGIGALAVGNFLLEELVVGAALDLDEIGRFDYLFKFSEIETVGHGRVWGFG